MMRRKTKKNSAADEWNAKHPIGTAVLFRTRATHTRSEAWLLGDGTAVVMVDGLSGGVSLDDLDVLAKADERR